MTKLRALIGGCAVMALGAATGCEEMPPPEVPVQAGVVAETPTYVQGDAYGQGQWVWTQQYGWVWVPANATPLEVQGEPYVYMYTPTYGWTWFDSPWGWYGPAGGWGWARPWYGSYWGPRYHAYAAGAVNVAPPAYRVAPRAYNVAPPAYRVMPNATNVAPPAYRVAPHAYAAPRVVAPGAMAPRRAVVTPHAVMAPRPFVAPLAPSHGFVHPGGGFHGGRR